MTNFIIILILLVLVAAAFRSTVKHFKGEGGCCGGPSAPKTPRKRLQGPKTEEWILHIEGMHCEHCKSSVERQINAIDGAAATVKLKKNLAVVVCDRPVEAAALTAAVEKAGFSVIGSEHRPLA